MLRYRCALKLIYGIAMSIELIVEFRILPLIDRKINGKKNPSNVNKESSVMKNLMMYSAQLLENVPNKVSFFSGSYSSKTMKMVALSIL